MLRPTCVYSRPTLHYQLQDVYFTYAISHATLRCSYDLPLCTATLRLVFPRCRVIPRLCNRRERSSCLLSAHPSLALALVRSHAASPQSAMLIKEFRIIMPLTVEEYGNAMVYSIPKASLEETGGGEGIEILSSKPFKNKPLRNGRTFSGVYTKKIHRVESKVNWFMRKLAPKEWMMAVEESWNAYPCIKTVLTNDGIGPGNSITIESMHLADRGTTQNAVDLPPERLEQREVIMIDIVSDPLHPDDYKESTDPTKFKSQKTHRGPLFEGWWKTCNPVMCAYKVVIVEFNRWPLLRSRIENYFMKYQRTFQRFNRQMFCWMDEWYGLSIQELRQYEEAIRKKLAEEIKSDTKRGVVGETE